MMAACLSASSLEVIRTKKTMTEMMVKTMTKMPTKRPVLALVQSTV